MEDLSSDLDDVKNKELEYEELLKDANAERRDEILANLNAVKKHEDKLNKEKEKAAKDIADAEYKAAAWRKAQAITDAVIQGALSVVEALPNVVLAALVGTLSTAAVATIVAQPLPPKPKAAEGMLVGAPHNQGGIDIEAEGGEFIINKRSTEMFLPLIEAINDFGKPKYGDGGQVTPTTVQKDYQLIDYDLLATKIKNGIQPIVSVVDITNAQNQVKVIEETASI